MVTGRKAFQGQSQASLMGSIPKTVRAKGQWHISDTGPGLEELPSMPNLLSGVCQDMVPRDGIEPPTQGFSVLGRRWNKKSRKTLLSTINALTDAVKRGGSTFPPLLADSSGKVQAKSDAGGRWI